MADSLNHLAHYLLASKLDTLLTSGRVTRLIEVRMLFSVLSAFKYYEGEHSGMLVGENLVDPVCKTLLLLDFEKLKMYNRQWRKLFSTPPHQQKYKVRLRVMTMTMALMMMVMMTINMMTRTMIINKEDTDNVHRKGTALLMASLKLYL